MAVSLAEIIILGLMADWLFRRFRVPGLIGMLLVGIALGPFSLGVLDADLMAISPDLRLIALIVILLRAGFELSRRTLHRVGRRALLLAFIPALVEGGAITLLAPYFLGLSRLESALLGFVLAAVSPAVVVPMMIRFNRERRGARKGIPTMILAAASVDDVFVIVVYSILLGIYTGHQAHASWRLAGVPVSILLGVLVGLGMGCVLCFLFERFNPRATKRVLVLIALTVLLVRLQRLVEAYVPFAALVSAMAIGFVILEKREHMAHEISAKLAKVWVFAEVLLFALVGAQVDLSVVWATGLAGLALILLALCARGSAVLLCLTRSRLTWGERLFTVVSFSPKATVQAAIGASPLMAMRMAGMDTGPGEIILALAVLSIVVTAPLGAWAIGAVGNRVLDVAPETERDAYEAALESNAGVSED